MKLDSITDAERMELWESLANNWPLVVEYATARVSDINARLCSPTDTPTLDEARFLQGQISMLRELAQLPEVELTRLRPTKKEA